MTGFDVGAIRQEFPDRQVEWLAETPSTMTEAARLASGGCPDGTVVGAEAQTAGQGRLGRHWHSAANEGLYISLVLRERLPPEQLPLVTLVLGLAAAEALTRAAEVQPDLRWPNDVLLGERKCCGILVQQQGDALIAGIGVNVNQREFPEPLTSLATSLRMVTGRTHRRELLLTTLLATVDEFRLLHREAGRDAILRLFTQRSSYVEGRRVVVEQGATLVRGTTAGLDRSGFLVLRDDAGRRTIVTAGGVRPV